MRQSWMAARRGAVLPEAARTTVGSRAPCRTNAVPGLKRSLRDEVHVWLVEPAAWHRAFGHDGLILSADEQSAADAFTLEPLRQRYTIAHCAVRRLLSLYADAAPESWVFRRSVRGRPCIEGDSGLRFSLSYGDDLVAIVITRDVAPGIDIVSTRRPVDVMQIAEYAFAPTEIAALRLMEADPARNRFFDCWALKEAYAKATGAGFRDKPNRYAFSFPRPGAIAFQHDASEDPGPWQFVLARAPREHRLAVAVRIGAGRARKLVARMAPGGEVAAITVERALPDRESVAGGV